MSDFIINGTLVSDVKRIKTFANADGTAGVLVEHTTGEPTTYPFPDSISAGKAYSAIIAARGAKSVSLPVITSILPATLDHTTLPKDIEIKGANFDSTATISLVAYGVVATALTVVFNNDGSLTVTVPNTVSVGAWNVLYSDDNGNTYVVNNGLLIV